jgi:hypothetical protein
LSRRYEMAEEIHSSGNPSLASNCAYSWPYFMMIGYVVGSVGPLQGIVGYM